MSANTAKVALITGANRGIGLETARGLAELGMTVIIGARDLAKGNAAAAALREQGLQAVAVHYDADDSKTITTVYDYIAAQFGKLDVLVNNAGISEEQLMGGNNSADVALDAVRHTFEVNLFAVIALTQRLLPLIRKAEAGRIVNLSSILGSLTLHSMADSPIAPAKSFAYNTSKTALNGWTVHLADALRGTNIKVNSAHPGWVKTELGGEHAPMELADSNKTSVFLATLPADGVTGGFFHEHATLPW